MITPKHLCRNICFTAFVLLTPCLQAEEKVHRIDQWLSKQIETNNSTAGMCEALYKAGQMWDKQMNVSYKYLMTKLKPTQKTNLKKSQRAWVVFRDAENKVQGILADPYFGTMGRVDAANEYYEMIKSRSQMMARYESRIREMHEEEN